jgi:hypothetical protein
VIDLEAWKRGHRPDAGAPAASDPPSPTDRLDGVLRRLDPLVRRGSGRVGGRTESELLAIIGAVNSGLLDEALARAERLAARLEHPSARAAR